MPLPKPVVELFDALMEAIVNNSTRLIQCSDKETGDPVYVIAISVKKDDDTEESYPVGVLYADQKVLMDSVNPPEGVETFDNNEEEKPDA